MTVAVSVAPVSRSRKLGTGGQLTLGSVRSRLIVTEAPALFPALSVAVPLTTWPAPSVVTLIGAGQDAIPDSASEQANKTVGGADHQPAAFAAGATEAVIVGGVVSAGERGCQSG